MELIMQPPGSWLCGQTCVAMIAGITLEQSIRIFGKRSGTTTKQVIRALRETGIECGDILIRARNHERPAFCMAVVHFRGERYTHWTIWKNGRYYDPAIGIIDEYPEDAWVTSYLPIYDKEEDTRHDE